MAPRESGAPESADRAAELEIVHLLRAVTVELGLHSARFAQANGMHATDVRALIALMDARRAGEETTAGRLGAALGLNSAGTTSVVDRLERAGLVRRVRGADDRRKVVVEVEERAVRLGQDFFGPLIARTVDLLTAYDERERAAIRGFLTGVRDAAAGGARGSAGLTG
ncbi:MULTISPECIES: MarR family winged helix-turn-helix transcriptional regulator [Streptomyces]|uniref:MarR family transcriptional regulator n=2 Tax=Streptomyces TaxID=1883 RepID=A0A2U9P0W6_STRAS|nr:helix-turn-helix domain-containing protein [Streptomyces actuosus]AWT42838.1 MarR family transcriptional regulator [Streptomyces actuosus]MBM4825046.1 MarR family transcriptional regulator [Streptomyces actuosus]